MRVSIPCLLIPLLASTIHTGPAMARSSLRQALPSIEIHLDVLKRYQQHNSSYGAYAPAPAPTAAQDVPMAPAAPAQPAAASSAPAQRLVWQTGAPKQHLPLPRSQQEAAPTRQQATATRPPAYPTRDYATHGMPAAPSTAAAAPQPMRAPAESMPVTPPATVSPPPQPMPLPRTASLPAPAPVRAEARQAPPAYVKPPLNIPAPVPPSSAETPPWVISRTKTPEDRAYASASDMERRAPRGNPMTAPAPPLPLPGWTPPPPLPETAKSEPAVKPGVKNKNKSKEEKGEETVTAFAAPPVPHPRPEKAPQTTSEPKDKGEQTTANVSAPATPPSASQKPALAAAAILEAHDPNAQPADLPGEIAVLNPPSTPNLPALPSTISSAPQEDTLPSLPELQPLEPAERIDVPSIPVITEAEPPTHIALPKEQQDALVLPPIHEAEPPVDAVENSAPLADITARNALEEFFTLPENIPSLDTQEPSVPLGPQEQQSGGEKIESAALSLPEDTPPPSVPELSGMATGETGSSQEPDWLEIPNLPSPSALPSQNADGEQSAPSESVNGEPLPGAESQTPQENSNEIADNGGETGNQWNQKLPDLNAFFAGDETAAIPVPPPPALPLPGASEGEAVAPPPPPPGLPAISAEVESESAETASLSASNASGAAQKADLEITFSPSETEVPLVEKSNIKELAARITNNPNAQITVIAYSSSGGDIDPRRISLSRGLAVRGQLIEAGVDNLRISVKARGDQGEREPRDRVDIFIE